MTDKANLAMLRKPFPDNQISKLPKPTKAQTEEVKANFKTGIRCDICGAWHHPKVVHLDYVGHAALTDRLLDVDAEWSWEPLAVGPDGLPSLDKDGGMWIRLTVCGVTRLGYGDAGEKKGGDAMKERIGDALRNAAMRFGAALDLWHKGDLHVEDVEETKSKPEKVQLPKAGPEAHAPAKLGFDMLDAETQDYLRSVGMDVQTLCNRGDIAGAVARIDSEELDADNKVGLWSLLDSKARSAIKAHGKVPA